MKRIAWTRYIALAGVICLLAAASGAFVDGGIKTVRALGHLGAVDHHLSVELVQLMDSFLLGAGLLIFGLGLYELFIGELELPAALKIADLGQLKGKLAVIIVLVLAVGFLEHFVDWEDGKETLLHGIAAAVMSAVLIALAGTQKAH